MEKSFFRRFFNAALLIMMAAVILVSCKKDDDDDPPTPPVIVEDGIYLVGAGTALTDFDIKGLFKSTRNEVTQEERTSLMEIFVAVKAGADGFNIIQVTGSDKISHGPGSDFAVVGEADRIGDEPKLDFWRGSLVATETPFTVPENGLYHVIIDLDVMKVVIVPVKYWGLIGAATPGGWTDDTQIPAGAFDLNTMTFEVNDVTMTKADFKFRYSGGWKVVIDDDVDLGGGVMGVRVNTNFGGAVNALVPGGANIANEEGGKYTAKMVWTLGAAYAATMTKSGDLEVFDYTNTELGLIGNGLVVNGAPHNWEETILLSTPTVENETNYTWTFSNVEVQPDSSGFKIREGQDWTGKSFGYPQVTMEGLAADDFETNDDGNFMPKVAGVYNIEFFIDAVTETYKFTVNSANELPKLWVPGEYQGWSPDTAPTIEDADEDGIFIGVVEFPDSAPSFAFKFTSQPDWDGTNYGDGGSEGTLSTDGGAGDLTVPGPGSYLFTVDINNLTWSYELQ
jgi:hypothetical protein